MSKPLIEVKDLKVYFKQKSPKLLSFKPGILKAVDQVSFSIEKGKTFGLVGESGSGKSTIGKAILRYHKPTGGEIFYEGTEIGAMGEKELLPYRKKMQSVFQDPYSSLDARMKVGKIIEEPLIINKSCATKAERDERVRKLMQEVGLDPTYIDRYPHEFSGGQRQRIVIARALAARPELLFCDEAVSALDVSVRAQILNLLQDLQDELKLTYLFCSHDLSVIEHICDRVAIMYLGKIVEIGTREDIFKHPKHPYTKALLSAIPMVGKKKERILLNGDIPSPVNPPSGCRFRTRCPYATDRCRQEAPELLCVSGEHKVACFLLEKPEPEQP